LVFFEEEWYWYLDFVLVQAWIQNWITYGVLDMVFFVILEHWFCFEQAELLVSIFLDTHKLLNFTRECSCVLTAIDWVTLLVLVCLIFMSLQLIFYLIYVGSGVVLEI